MLGCKTAYDFKLFVGEVGPCGVVGVGVYQRRYATCGEIAFEFFFKLLATEFVDVERLLSHSEHMCLGALCRESGIEEKHRVLFFVAVLEEEHQGEASLHRAYCGDDEFRLEVHVEESLCEFCSVLLEHRNALDGRVLVGYPASERGTFGLDAYRCGR